MAYILKVHAQTASLMIKNPLSQAADLSTRTWKKSLISGKVFMFYNFAIRQNQAQTIIFPQSSHMATGISLQRKAKENLYSLKDERIILFSLFALLQLSCLT